MMILMLLWKLSLISQEVNNMNDYQKHVCRDYHCLKVRFCCCLVCCVFYISVHIVVIATMKEHENNIKFTILFHWDLWVLLLQFCLYCSHDTTKEQRHQTQYRKVVVVPLAVGILFCLFVIQAQQQTRLCIIKSTQFKIHAVYFILYVNFGRLFFTFNTVEKVL